MIVEVIRSGSLGIAGTLKNADHHAKTLLPLLHYLAPKIPTLPLERWLQGHNVHVLATKDSRRFTLRPFAKKGEGYLGVRLSLRVSRSIEIPLSDCYADERNQSYADFFRLLGSLTAIPAVAVENLSQNDLP